MENTRTSSAPRDIRVSASHAGSRRTGQIVHLLLVAMPHLASASFFDALIVFGIRDSRFDDWLKLLSTKEGCLHWDAP